MLTPRNKNFSHYRVVEIQRLKMKFTSGLILLLFLLVNSKENKIEIKSFSNALSHVIKGYYIKTSVDFEFIIYGEKSESFAREIITNVVKSNPVVGLSDIVVKKRRRI